jgi:hypothetical protein
MPSKVVTLQLTVEFDPDETDADEVATQLNILLNTALSTDGVLDGVAVGDLEVVDNTVLDNLFPVG